MISESRLEFTEKAKPSLRQFQVPIRLVFILPLGSFPSSSSCYFLFFPLVFFSFFFWSCRISFCVLVFAFGTIHQVLKLDEIRSHSISGSPIWAIQGRPQSNFQPMPMIWATK